MTAPPQPQSGLDGAAGRPAGWRPRWPLRKGTAPVSVVLPRELMVFLAVALLGFVIVGTASALISSRLARDTAREEAQAIALRLARFVVAPLLQDALNDVPGKREALDTLIETRMEDGSLLLVLVWSGDGEVIYSSDEARIGEMGQVTGELRSALEGDTISVLDDEPETALPRVDGPVLEVYAPFRFEGRDMVFEAYFNGDSVTRDTALLRRQLLPLTIGGLIALQAVQIPLAVSLGRRLVRQDSERNQLVEQHLAASERERREIAADLHDGPVQDLAGVSYALSALRPRVPEDARPRVDRMVEAVRDAVASLRRLMVDIYPPDLSASGLLPALEDLAEPLRDRGLDVHVSGSALPEVPPETAAVLYRSAKEALANVVRHAEARSIWIDVVECILDIGPCIRLTVADDGKGIPGVDAGDMVALPISGDGHFGLRLVRDRVVETGGSLTVGARSGGGTVVTVDVPVRGSTPPA